MAEATPKAKYLNTIELRTEVKLFSVKCLKCKKDFVTPRWGGTSKISAVPCMHCDCMFNVDWE